MKKLGLALATLLTISASTGFAAPINDLDKGQTAIGFGVHNTDPGSNTFYIENKMGDNFTLGLQTIDWDHSGSMNDVYGQINLNSNLRAIVGDRNFDSASKFYIGAAVTAPLAPEWNGYASMIAGSEFKELQVGANYKMTNNVDFNINYRSFMPDYGSNNNGLGFGATFKL